MRLERRSALVPPHRMGEEAQAPARRDARVLLAQRAGGRVPGIGEGLVAFGLHRLVEPGEVFFLHVDLAAHLDELRGLAAERQGDRADRLHVRRDVLSGLAVAAGGGRREAPVFVDQAHRDAVDLGLDDVGAGFALEEAPDLGFPSMNSSGL